MFTYLTRYLKWMPICVEIMVAVMVAIELAAPGAVLTEAMPSNGEGVKCRHDEDCHPNECLMSGYCL